MLPQHLITPTQVMYLQGKTRKATLQADGKTLHFFRLNTACKRASWQVTGLPVHYRTRQDALIAKGVWESNGVILNRDGNKA